MPSWTAKSPPVFYFVFIVLFSHENYERKKKRNSPLKYPTPLTLFLFNRQLILMIHELWYKIFHWLSSMPLLHKITVFSISLFLIRLKRLNPIVLITSIFLQFIPTMTYHADHQILSILKAIHATVFIFVVLFMMIWLRFLFYIVKMTDIFMLFFPIPFLYHIHHSLYFLFLKSFPQSSLLLLLLRKYAIFFRYPFPHFIDGSLNTIFILEFLHP